MIIFLPVLGSHFNGKGGYHFMPSKMWKTVRGEQWLHKCKLGEKEKAATTGLFGKTPRRVKQKIPTKTSGSKRTVCSYRFKELSSSQLLSIIGLLVMSALILKVYWTSDLLLAISKHRAAVSSKLANKSPSGKLGGRDEHFKSQSTFTTSTYNSRDPFTVTFLHVFYLPILLPIPHKN